MECFNLRVYGIWVNDQKQILLSDEVYKGQQFSKFPGGGLELGESIIECLKREFIEECQLAIEPIKLLYITEEVIPSAFDDSQVIGVYYQVSTLESLRCPTSEIKFNFKDGEEQALRWINLDDFNTENLTFAMDRNAWAAIQTKLIL